MGDTTFACRMLDTLEELEFGAALEGITRSEFVRRSVRERARRLEQGDTGSKEQDDAK